MAFIIKIDNRNIAKIIKGLEKMCSVLTFDFSKQGLGLNVSDDNNSTGFSVMLDSGYFEDYDFTGDGVERVSLNANKFVKILEKMSYPFQMESTMDGSIRLVSATGRQTYKQNLIESAEKYHSKSEVIQASLENLMDDESGITIKLMRQDLREALINVGVDSKNTTIGLDGDKLEFMADSMEVEAEISAMLQEPVKGNWELTYNIKYFKDLLDVVGDNTVVTMNLFEGRKSFVLAFELEDEKSYCRFSLAPVLQRRKPEEVVVEEVDDDDSES